jgi:hypothetical protein
VYGAQKGLSFNSSVVKLKAMQLCNHYAESGSEENGSSFHINRRWFEKLKKWMSLFNVKRIGASSI